MSYHLLVVLVLQIEARGQTFRHILHQDPLVVKLKRCGSTSLFSPKNNIYERNGTLEDEAYFHVCRSLCHNGRQTQKNGTLVQNIRPKLLCGTVIGNMTTNFLCVSFMFTFVKKVATFFQLVSLWQAFVLTRHFLSKILVLLCFQRPSSGFVESTSRLAN